MNPSFPLCSWEARGGSAKAVWQLVRRHKEPQSKRIRWQKSNDVVPANSFFPYSTVQCSRHQHANRCAECDPFSYVVGCGPDRRSYCHANSNSDVHYHTAPSLPTIFVTSTT
jgi:hypothetical protein